MRVISWDEATDSRKQENIPSIATIGVFDGLHKGHQALVDAVRGQAGENRKIVVTFTKNPKQVKAPAQYAGDLFSLEQKLAAFADNKMDLCILIDFSENFSKMSGEDFIHSLVKSCGVRFFIVGWDFTCGYRLSTKAVDLRRIAALHKASVDIVPPVLLDGTVVSSSKIRSALLEGRTDLALAMLGSPYTLDVRGYGMESRANVRFAKLDASLSVIPAQGRYAASLRKDELIIADSVLVLEHGIVQWNASTEVKPDFIVFGQKL